MLDFDLCYKAIESRDRRFDGRFFTGVLTTGIYCRPICPARTPNRKNVTFFTHAAAAAAAGFRPCRRCRPEASPESPSWNVSSSIVRDAMTLIDEGVMDGGDELALAQRLHVTERHVRRLFARETGASPLDIARHRRVQRAHRLITTTNLPMTDVAYSAGFGSIRQFNDTMKRAFGASPTQLRSDPKMKAAPGAPLTLRLRYEPPYDRAALFSFLGSHITPGLDLLEDGVYSRSFVDNGSRAIVSVSLPEDAPHALLIVRTLEGDPLQAAVSGVRELLDLDASTQAISRALSRDATLRPVIRRRMGLRIPGALDRFEVAFRTIVGQQVSVTGANTIAGRIVRRWGSPTGALDGPLFHFPDPETLAEAPLEKCGLPGARARALRSLAGAVATGDISLDVDVSQGRLMELPGIGPWSAGYISMRVLRDPDAFPHGDLGLLKAVERLYGEQVNKKELEDMSERWRPWRAYAAMHLWASLAETGG